MTVAGWIFLAVAWSAVLSVAGYCMWRTWRG